MKEKPNIVVEIDTAEMRKWRSLSQSELDLCWGKLAERMKEEVLNKYEVEEAKKRLSEVEVLLWSGEGCAKARNTEQESGEKIAGKEFSLCLENTTCSVHKASRRSQRK